MDQPGLSTWEQAYLRFETPEQEVRKFKRRLRQLGADAWPRQSVMVELFCGRGNGLRALQELGFDDISGLDLSPALAAQHTGPGRVRVGDARALPWPDASCDVAVVQGGLHHLAQLPEDLERAVGEVARVLRPGGRFVVVEPWNTPFLRMVHAVCRLRLARRCSAKVDALATMIDHERPTYEQWLRQPRVVLEVLRRFFRPEQCRMSWGKLMFVGRPRADGPCRSSRRLGSD